MADPVVARWVYRIARKTNRMIRQRGLEIRGIDNEERFDATVAEIHTELLQEIDDPALRFRVASVLSSESVDGEIV